jgi:[ribosomal protein S5]-alanine N-acetyltransferase
MPSTSAAYAAYLERSRLETNAFYLARRREDDAIVGFLNLSEIVRGNFQSAYLGYGTVAEFAGRGCCGFELEGFSPRYLKIGGRWCDHERWAITKESWRRRRGRGG